MSMEAESLYFCALEGKWNEVVKEYESNVKIHRRAINSTKDTALHVAVKDGRADIVKMLVHQLSIRSSLSALQIGNDKGDTPLHCAAWKGSLEMCESIAQAQPQGADSNLIVARNKKGETPLYLAALQGHTEAFLYLYDRCADKSVGPFRRTRDGDTVLHCTIRQDHFELAYEIIGLCGEQIVGSVDEKGITPLHILANKPSAFESSSNFRWYNRLVYNCIMLEPFVIPEQRLKNDGTSLNRSDSAKTQKGGGSRTTADTENPCEGDYGYENVPPNYRTFCHILMRAVTCFLWLIFGAFGTLIDLSLIIDGRQPSVVVTCRIDDGDDINTKGKPDADGNQNQPEGNKPEQKTSQIVPVDKSKQKGGEEKKNNGDRRESALFIAAKNGVVEIVKKILKDKPGAIHESNVQGQNVLHVAVEYRQPHVFGLLKEERLWDNLLRGVDNDGNTVLHVAARLSQYKPWHIPGSALQMQWEIKWFLYIKDIYIALTPRYVLFLHNNLGDTRGDFRKDHEDLVREGAEWLKSTSESCSVVAALIAGVAFATSTTIPAALRRRQASHTWNATRLSTFALTSLLALLLLHHLSHHVPLHPHFPPSA
ncbi:uncharacterized protein LOC114717469 [Neltuma alba]|uniref:uncharacterized protein LOC114717469 n=1 Tax=Neltuma alba TaxID=207710 RepID=UPI0010A313D5|nr:uncharacterized protein LOC114717469 [Prosopis alba]